MQKKSRVLIRKKILTLCNHKGGCGKTTTVVNLAAEFGRMGYKVLAIDLDPQGNTSGHIGRLHGSEVPLTAADILATEPGTEEGQAKIRGCVQTETNAGFENVHLIYSSLDLHATGEALRQESLRPYEELRRRLPVIADGYDVILIDTQPLLSTLTLNAVAAADYVMIPFETNSQYTLQGTSDLLALIQRIQSNINPSLSILGALLVRHDPRMNACQVLAEAVGELIGSTVPVTIPVSVKVAESGIAKSPVSQISSKNPVALAYRNLAKHLATVMEG